ncbi:hypothetical protein DCO48_22490, partial [Pseudomonas sp. SDI]|uniref:hypothetical protein n=1 Tax=Pseudomonas sp. SDI TaxID=2170734 RepID=UPI000DE6EE9D
MVSANRVAEFIASDNYQKNLQKINLLTSIEVQGEYGDAHSIITQKKMMAAQVEIVDIEECLAKLSGVAASYTMRKHKATYDLDESIGISGESEN